MKLSERCRCGAKFSVADEDPSRVSRYFDEWLARHETGCPSPRALPPFETKVEMETESPVE